MRGRILPIIAVLICLAGCTMAPTYTRPALPVPEAWPAGEAYRGTEEKREGSSPGAVGWRDFYGDERLKEIIGLALDNNRDLRIAALNIEKARAIYQIQRADLLPTVYLGGSGTEQRMPAAISTTGESTTNRQYNVGVGFTSYELDLFGRVRSLKDQALEQYLATGEARRSVRITLIAEVANTFFLLAADRERLKLARETLESQEASYRLIERRFKAGASTELDLSQARTRVEAARVDVALYTARVAQDENALNLLAGAQVPKELLADKLEAEAVLKDITVGLPSEELLRRPDVLAAEHQLKGANANIGAARAAFFPRILLTTAYGTVSPELSGLFRAGSDTWGFSPQITLPIFDTGRNMAALDAATTDRDIYLARYEKAIQVAFREVADALALRGTVEDQIKAQQALVEAATGVYGLSDARYRAGIDSYLPTLDAQRSLYGAQQGLITLRLARLASLVTLYKVLGGGGEQEKAGERWNK